jgi:NAD(P)-dependent dehydrogenase (short-subunit alcohol dehydrogenase family)
VSKPDEKGAVCVTGAAGGIGVALVRRLLDEGYGVSAWDMAPGPLAQITDEHLVFETLDVRDGAAMKGAAQRAQARFGFVHGLVSLAAIYRTQPFLDIDDATFDLHFSINLKGSLLAAQAVLPLMRARKSGAIVLFSSSLARNGGTNSAAYAATKGGVLGLMRSMALDVAGDNVRVNAVSPAIADTAMPRGNLDDAMLTARAAANPMGRLGSPRDMAEAALFLLDKENGFMTGQDIRVTGGALLF